MQNLSAFSLFPVTVLCFDSFMILLKNIYQNWFLATLLATVLSVPTHTLSHEIKYIILWASTSPTGPISGVGRQFEKYTFSNLEDCEAQIAKELWDDEHDGDWKMVKSHYGDPNRIGARLKENADKYESRTLYICNSLEPYPD